MTIEDRLEQQSRELAEIKALLAQVIDAREPDITDRHGAMEILNLRTEGSLYVLMHRNPDLPRRKLGRKLLFSRSDLQAWLARRAAAKEAA